MSESAEVSFIAGRYGDATSVRLGSLINIRWMAVAGQVAALLIVYFGMGLHFPLPLTLLAVALSVGINLYLYFVHGPMRRLSDREAALQLAYDLGQLAVLLYLTGGIQNPFTILMLAPVTISATVLGRKSTLVLLSCAVLLTLLLVFWHMPLPWDDQPLQLARRYLWGLWGGVAVSMVFLTLYATRISGEARHRANALAAVRAALDREHHLAALGTLAAAAAHELGTPLGSILLAARDIQDDLAESAPHAATIDTIVGQAQRCRDILKSLSVDHGEKGGIPFDRISAEVMVSDAARPYEKRGKTINIATLPDLDGRKEQPQLNNRVELRYGLGNLIENAVGFADHQVNIWISWTVDELSVDICDDGPGFPAGMLQKLGEPYVSARGRGSNAKPDDAAGGLGLGIFIATTLIEETGGRVLFSNRPGGGASARVMWRLTDL